MKNKKNLFALFLICISTLCSQQLEISLPTQNKETVVYLGQCRSQNYTLSNLVNYVITEDFKVDGRGVLFEKNEAFLSLEASKEKNLFQDPLWKKNRIDFAIIPKLTNNGVTFDLFNVRKGTIKTLAEVKLRNNREENISTIHRISDFLMEQSFGTPGIASKRILYSYKPYRPSNSTDENSWNAEIYETDSLGLINTRITYDNSYSITPEFVGNNSGKQDYEFIYVTYKIGQPQIYHSSRRSKRGVSLVKLRGNQLLPKISYDGKYISFVSDASGTSDIFLQCLGKRNRPHGKPLQVYSGINQTSASPHLSPDNKHMVFVSDKTGTPKIYIANVENTISNSKRPTLERIASPCSECTAPSFSPDGAKITFSGKINGRRQIWLYDIKQKKAYQLTSGVEDKENPSFGSDSRHIVYNTTTPTMDLFLLSIDQKKIRRLTKGSGEKHYPAFEK